MLVSTSAEQKNSVTFIDDIATQGENDERQYISMVAGD